MAGLLLVCPGWLMALTRLTQKGGIIQPFGGVNSEGALSIVRAVLAGFARKPYFWVNLDLLKF